MGEMFHRKIRKACVGSSQHKAEGDEKRQVGCNHGEKIIVDLNYMEIIRLRHYFSFTQHYLWAFG